MKVAIIGPDSELIRAKLNEISEQTGIIITEVMKTEIEDLPIYHPNIYEVDELYIEVEKCERNETYWLDSHYQELKENRQEIKNRSLSLNKSILPLFIQKQNIIRNKNSLQRRNKNSRYGKKSF